MNLWKRGLLIVLFVVCPLSGAWGGGASFSVAVSGAGGLMATASGSGSALAGPAAGSMAYGGMQREGSGARIVRRRSHQVRKNRYYRNVYRSYVQKNSARRRALGPVR
jgi:hypothetical protein